MLQDGGPAALTAIRAERAEFAETVVHPAVKIGQLTHPHPRIHPRGRLPRKDRINLVLAKRWLVYQRLGRTVPGPVAIPAVRTTSGGIAPLFDHAVVTDASQSGVRRSDAATSEKADHPDQANDEGAAADSARKRLRCRSNIGRALSPTW